LLGVASVPSPADAMLQPLAVAAERDLSDDAAEKLRRIMAPPGAGSTFSALAGWADTVKRRQPRPTVAAGQIVLSEMGKTS
jgi:hypothetical protein